MLSRATAATAAGISITAALVKEEEMSRYPSDGGIDYPQRRYPDRGFDYQNEPPFRTPDRMESMSPLAQAALLMNPKALQIMSYVQNLGAQKEERERRRQLFDMALEDRRRAQAHDDFKTAVALHDSGYLPVLPGVAGKFQAGLGGRDTVVAPNAQQYSRPTEEQRFERDKTAAVRAGALKGYEARTAEEISNPNETIDVPDILGGGTAQVKKTAKLDTLLKIYEKAHPKLDFHATTPNNAGEVKIWSVDPITKKVQTHGSIDDAGKTKSYSSDKTIPDFDAKVKGLMDQWRDGYYAQVGITPDVAEMAKGTGGIGPGAARHKDAVARVHAADEVLYKRAVDSLKNQPKGGGSAPGVTVTPPPTTKLNPSTEIQRAAKLGKPMPAANVAKAAAGLGISVEEFSRLWHSAGGTIAK